jgi:gas vesicle protein
MGIIGKTLRFILGLALGMVIGAVAILLAAPQSGRVTQEQIQARVDEMMGAAKKAQRDRERELQEYWEQEIDIKGQRQRDEEDKK